MEDSKKSLKEQRIRKITSLYYSKPEIQKTIFEFSKNREVVPRYFEGFGKRPDALQYPSDIFELVKKGATSFNASEEIWKDPLELSTEMDEEQMNNLRTGWDLLIDIDSKYIDYSKIYAQLIIEILKFHGIENIGLKFSGSKGFHIIIPWKAFPKEVNGIRTSTQFPKWPRIILQYIHEQIKNKLIKKITDLSKPNKYVLDYKAPREVIPDLVLVSPRHLFRTPYSLHEKTALASIVLDLEKLENFELKNADPLKAKIKNFIPDSEEGEASELLREALDWYKQKNPNAEEKKNYDFKPVKLKEFSDKNFPPCIKKILQGLKDGRKRALFVLINFFRSVGMERDEAEKKIWEWNKNNKVPLKEGYIDSQISWSYKRKPMMPPNCQEYYKGIGTCFPDNLCKKIKNPVNYMIRKSFVRERRRDKEK